MPFPSDVGGFVVSITWASYSHFFLKEIELGNMFTLACDMLYEKCLFVNSLSLLLGALWVCFCGVGPFHVS